jgi:hypothetical protein
MVSFSYPSLDFEDGAVSEQYYERLQISSVADGLVGLPTETFAFGEGAGGLQVKITANRRALVRGFMYEAGPTDVVVPISPNTSGSTRTDLLVLRLDRSTWNVREGVRAGTPGAGLPNPVQTDAGIWELPVAQVLVANNATNIASSAVTNRGWWIDDGRLLARPGALPPHYPSRQVLEWDTTTSIKRQLFSDGAVWQVLWEDTGNQASALVAGWTASVNTVRRRSGIVTCHLTLRRHPGGTLAASGGAYSHAATIPAGYRPAETLELPVYATGPRAATAATITPAGQVSIRRDVELTFGTYFILAPATWVAA